MKFGTGSNAERTQKYGGSKYKMTYVRPYNINKQTSPIFSFLASERSERDTYRGNTIENRGCLFIYLLANERSERDSIRGG